MASEKEPGRFPVHLAHHHPGRVRLRSKAFLGADTAAAAVEALKRKPGVHSVEHRPISGSVLVRYEPGQIEPSEIVAHAAQAQGLGVSYEPVHDPADLPRLVVEVSREFNEFVARATGYRVDARGFVPLTLAGLAGYSLLTKKDRLPRWDNLAYWAFAVFTQLHREEVNAHPMASRADAASAGQSETGVPGGAL